MKLTASARRAIPKRDFAGPGRSYPIEDKSHARAALSMAHNAPASEQAEIRAKADAKLGRKKATPRRDNPKDSAAKERRERKAGIAT